jgi:hypothetical protein
MTKEIQWNIQKLIKELKKEQKQNLDFTFNIAVSILLIVINLSSSTQYLWFKWPLMGWGIGVLFHALGVFVFSGRTSVTEKMIEKEMMREDLKKK